ncbi:uncharacterized protein At4g02000-like [Jatropha curcas]|uniref:uncharacterized protein At4g02000-like n=1 Tax=Jatropha curcas TaxID=180498 RepID=UPI0005FBAE7C|nr:uncharacterized protein At4g02000-like [Jatropha curcas]
MEESNISVEMGNLSVDGEGEGGLAYGEELTKTNSYCLYLVRRFLAKQVINYNAMTQIMTFLWTPTLGIQPKELNGRLYIYQFCHEYDLNHIIEMSPWMFDNHLLLLEKMEGHNHPMEVPLFYTRIWVQVHDLQVGFMSERVMRDIGEVIGEFVSTNLNNFTRMWKSYMRIRVRLDVWKPFRKGVRLKHMRGEWFCASFKYERLLSLCFICSLMGHTECFCLKHIEVAPVQAVRMYSVDIQAPNCHSQMTI